MTTGTQPRKKATAKVRLEVRVETEPADLITQAARKHGVSRTAFVSEAARDAALKVIPAPTSPLWPLKSSTR